MPNITAFNTKKHHIHLSARVTLNHGEHVQLRAILDTGAPFTEISDEFLSYCGLFERDEKKIQIKSGLETQKYGKIVLPVFEVCSHQIQNLTAFISRFDKNWGIDVLIGLDFFRQFKVTIDYKNGQLITEPF